MKEQASKHRVVLYVEKDSPLCDIAREALRRLRREFDFALQEVDVSTLPPSSRRLAPTAVIDGRLELTSPLGEERLRRALQGVGAAKAAPMSPLVRSLVLLADRAVLFVCRHWLLLANLAVALYAGLPFLAPLLMKEGLVGPAHLIYGFYKLGCHQLPERSFFLFGPKAVYSLGELMRGGLKHLSPLARRNFIGTPALGYKMAYCQRDTAIYTALLLAGLAFALVRKRARPLPFKVFLLVLVPLALDGITQLLGMRESTWLLRVITGGLLGVSLVWLIYPYVEREMRELRRLAEERLEEGRQGMPLSPPQ